MPSDLAGAIDPAAGANLRFRCRSDYGSRCAWNLRAQLNHHPLLVTRWDSPLRPLAVDLGADPHSLAGDCNFALNRAVSLRVSRGPGALAIQLPTRPVVSLVSKSFVLAASCFSGS